MAEILPDLQGGDQLGAMEAVSQDFENVQTAWYRAIETGREGLLQPALESVELFCNLRSLFESCNQLFDAARRRFAGSGSLFGALIQCYYKGPAITPQERIKNVMRIAETIQEFENTFAEALVYGRWGALRVDALLRGEETLAILGRSLQLFEEIDDLYHQAWVLGRLVTYYSYVDKAQQQKLLEREIALRRQINDQAGLATALNSLEVDDEDFVQHHEELYQIHKRFGNRHMVAWSGVTAGNRLITLGELEKGRAYLAEALQIIDEVNESHLLIWVLAIESLDAMLCQEPARVAIAIARMKQVNVLRPDMLRIIHWFSIYLAHERRDLAELKKQLARFGGVYEPLHARDTIFVFAFCLLHDLENRYGLVAEYLHFCEGDNWLRVLPLTQELKTRARENLERDEFEAAAARGRDLDVYAVAARMQADGYFE
jgi:hypothetical protein